MRQNTFRYSLQEYQESVDLILSICSDTGRSADDVKRKILEAGRRVAGYLNFSSNPLSIAGNSIRAVGFSGLLRIDRNIELEVSPKFLDQSSTDWQEDFLYLSTISRFGHLLLGERVASSPDTIVSIPNLVARAFVSTYKELRRSPIRQYRKRRVEQFEIDGDVDPVDLAIVPSTGYPQRQTQLTKSNPWNALIYAAAGQLIPEVTDSYCIHGLQRVLSDLSPQDQLRRVSNVPPVPGRNRSWKMFVDYSRAILDGFGLSYSPGSLPGIGYVFSTWQLWEDFVTASLKAGFGSSNVEVQRAVNFGFRAVSGGIEKPVRVYPDCVLQLENGYRIVVDAKYKGKGGRESFRVSEADLYEAYAFARALGLKIAILLYPGAEQVDGRGAGSAEVREVIEVDEIKIQAMTVQVPAVSKTRLAEFSSNLGESILVSLGPSAEK